eukprot:3272099-Amphidinium_carterae.1
MSGRAGASQGGLDVLRHISRSTLHRTHATQEGVLACGRSITSAFVVHLDIDGVIGVHCRVCFGSEC